MHSALAMLRGWAEGGSDSGRKQWCLTACWWQLCYWWSRDTQGISPRANGASALVALSVLCKHPSCPRFPKENQGMGELYTSSILYLCRSPQRPLNFTILGARKYNVTEKASHTEIWECVRSKHGQSTEMQHTLLWFRSWQSKLSSVSTTYADFPDNSMVFPACAL